MVLLFTFLLICTTCTRAVQQHGYDIIITITITTTSINRRKHRERGHSFWQRDCQAKEGWESAPLQRSQTLFRVHFGSTNFSQRWVLRGAILSLSLYWAGLVRKLSSTNAADGVWVVVVVAVPLTFFLLASQVVCTGCVCEAVAEEKRGNYRQTFTIHHLHCCNGRPGSMPFSFKSITLILINKCSLKQVVRFLSIT